MALAGGYRFWLDRTGRVYPNVHLEGIALGTAPPAAVRERLTRWAEAAGLGTDGSWEHRRIVVRAGGRAWEFTGEELGLWVDLGATAETAQGVGRDGGGGWRSLVRLVAVTARGRALTPVVRFDQPALERALVALAAELDEVPMNVSVDLDSGAVTAGQAGRLVDLSSAAGLLAAVAGATPSADPVVVELPIRTLEPRGDLQRLAAIDLDCLARFETHFDPSEAGRTWNIALAAGMLDGSLLEPGGALSFNRSVGPRTTAAGFRAAPEIVERELVWGIGGGVCQVATAVFNAGLLADLEVVERYHHSRPLGYVNLGRDATVAYPQLDLVIRNPRSFPVVLSLKVEMGRLRAAVWGRRTSDAIVRLETQEFITQPATWEVMVSPDLSPGQKVVEREAFDGREVRLWRELLAGNRVVRRELILTDYYDSLPGQLKVGGPQLAGDEAGPATETSPAGPAGGAPPGRRGPR